MLNQRLQKETLAGIINNNIIHDRLVTPRGKPAFQNMAFMDFQGGLRPRPSLEMTRLDHAAMAVSLLSTRISRMRGVKG
jgi:hypothetical protein